MISAVYMLDEEALSAFEDIVRYGSVEAVQQAYRDTLLQTLAQAAITALYDRNDWPSPKDIAPKLPYSNGLAIQFIPLSSLSKRQT